MNASSKEKLIFGAPAMAVWGAMLAVYIVWGSTYLAIRFAVETMPPFLMAAIRFLIAGGLLYGWRRLQGDPSPTRREWRSAAIVGIFMLTLGNGLVVWAEQRVTSGIAALLVGSVPLWIVLLDALRPGGRRPGWQTLVGVLVGFGGIALLVNPSDLGGAQDLYLPGAIALLAASLFWAVGALYSRSAKLPASPLIGTSMEMLAGGGGLLLGALVASDFSRLDLAGIAAHSWWGLGYLIVFGSLVGFVSYTWLLRVAPTPMVSSTAYVNPLIAIFIGNLLAQEPLTARTLISTLVILGSVFLINTASRPAPAPKPAPLFEPSAGDD